MDTVGKRLRCARESIHQNKEQVMKALGISNLGRIENDQRHPSLETLASLATYYGVSIDWIVTGKEHILESSSPWQLNEEQRKTAHAYFPDLTEEQVALLNNFEKLPARDKKEIRMLIEVKLESLGGAEFSSSASFVANMLSAFRRPVLANILTAFPSSKIGPPRGKNG